MSSSTYFFQGCPTCGRRLRIRVEYLGKRVVCQHCQGSFVASDPANLRRDRAEYDSGLLRVADELLQSVAERRPPDRSPYPR